MKFKCIYFLALLFLVIQNGIAQDFLKKNKFWAQVISSNDSLSLLIRNKDSSVNQIQFDNMPSYSQTFSQSELMSINFNPALRLNDSLLSQIFVPLKLLGKNAKTMMVVYQVIDSINENAVWTYTLNPEKFVGLTSQNLITLNKEYKYSDSNLLKPFINTVVFYSNEKATDSTSKLIFGKTDSLGFNGLIAEALLFDKHLKGNELTRWQTYLAVKYGIKLIETNYLNSTDTIIWEYSSDFNGAIAGIGFDSLYGLNQKQSRSASEDDIICLGAGTIDTTNEANQFVLTQNQSLIWAHNELPVEVTNDTINIREDLSDYMYYSLLQRKWLLQSTGTGTSTIPTQLQFDGAALHVAPGDVFYLLIDRSATGDFTPTNAVLIEPDSISPNGMVYFNDLLWDTDNSGKDMFTFSFIKIFTSESRNEEITSGGLNPSANAQTVNLDIESISGGMSYSLYPNPTAGEYTLEVISDTETSIHVRLLDVSGRVIKITEKPEAKQLSIKDVLPGKGIYFLEVRTERALKIFKVVMK